MLLIRTYEKCCAERIISILGSETGNIIKSYVITHVASAVVIGKICLLFPILLHTFITAFYELNIEVIGALMKVLKSSVPFELRMDIRVIPEQIKLAT
jgi:hypothetical protein